LPQATPIWGAIASQCAPAGTWNHTHDGNPSALFTYFAEQLNRFGLAYLHIVEPRVKVVAKESSDVIAIY
jgi:N-ethylmaleimide reductase